MVGRHCRRLGRVGAQLEVVSVKTRLFSTDMLIAIVKNGHKRETLII